MKNENKKNKSFVEKYWIYIILVTLICLASGMYIETNFTDGNIISKQITIFDNNESKIVNNYVFQSHHTLAKPLSSFLYSFAMSLIISLFILLVIQKSDHEKRKEELFQSVFQGVFNRLVPNEIFDVIKRDILEANIVRRNVKWIYDFKIENEALVLYRNVMYEVENLSNRECTELFSYIFSKTNYSETKILFLKWHPVGKESTTEVLYDHNGVFDACNVDTNFSQVKHEIKIPHDQRIMINFKSQETFKSLDFLHETHFTTACSIGWELEVNYPKEYSFSIISMFTPKLHPIVDDVERKKYSYNGAILKGQGIEFTLSKS